MRIFHLVVRSVKANGKPYMHATLYSIREGRDVACGIFQLTQAEWAALATILDLYEVKVTHEEATTVRPDTPESQGC